MFQKLALHHCEDIIKTIKECKRILKDNGIIIIVEHDIWRDEDNMIINLQHLIYRYIFNEKKDKSIDLMNKIIEEETKDNLLKNNGF